jgi:YjbE family integral membrane protein
MAVKSLPKAQRTKGILFGAAAAVVLRIVMTFFAYKLVELPYVKLIGGVLVLWVGVKLFAEGAPGEDRCMEAKTLWQTIWLIVNADISMSLDNVLAVAGACKGDGFLLLFGLGLSIPLVLFTSSFFSTLLDRYPLVCTLPLALLSGSRIRACVYRSGCPNRESLGSLEENSISGLFRRAEATGGRVGLRGKKKWGK